MSSNEDEWEYFDDSTTLTDLWQFLKDENLENDPLSFWLKTPLVDLPDAVHDYWRLKVPLILSPSYGYTSVDQPLNLDIVKQSLLDPLDAFICGSNSVRDVFTTLAQNDTPSPVCGKSITAGLASYGCRDCGQDATCVMCTECFNVSEHRNHNYRMSTTTAGNGFCDCGDPEAFLQYHRCQIHEEAYQRGLSGQDPLESFPEDLRIRTKELFRIILHHIIAITTTRKTKMEEWIVGEKEKQTWPDLEYPFKHSTHCCLLMNDDSHSYIEVTSIIKKVLKCQDKKAMDLTELVDKVGRAVISVGNYRDCVKIREQVEQKSDRDNQPLRVTILPAYMVAHQVFALRLCTWLMELFAMCSGFRDLFFQVLQMEDDLIDDEKNTFLVKLLTKSSMTWKAVRRASMELIVEVALKSPETKLKLGQVYLENYRTIMVDFMSDDQEPDVSIANLSVQIFTVPSVAHHLLESFDALSHLVKFFTQIFEDETKFDDNGQLDLTDWLDERQYDYTRCSHILTDIQYLLSAEPAEWSSKMRQNVIHGAKALIDLIARLQLADPQARVTGAHVLQDSQNWYCVFNILSQLMFTANLVRNWCRKEMSILKPITHYLLETMEKIKSTGESKELSINGKSYRVIHFDVLREPSSIHIPLHEFLIMILTCFNEDSEEMREMITLHGSVIDIINPVLTVLTVLAQIKNGMWRRNGMYGDGPFFLYNDPKVAPQNKRNDLTILQAAFSIVDDPDVLLVSLLDRFNLLEWALMNTDDSELPEETFILVDELLLLIIATLCETQSVDVSDISQSEELKYRLIHLIVSGNLCHSDIVKNMDHKSEGKVEAQVEEVLHQVADLVTSKKDTSKRIYQLKSPSLAINPFYYFYTRSQRDEVDAATFTNEIFNKPPNPEWPPLRPLFKGLSRLLHTPVMMIMIKAVLTRWLQATESKTVLVKHLHKVLFLINLGFNMCGEKFGHAFREENLDFLGKIKSVPPELLDLFQFTLSKANAKSGGLQTLKTQGAKESDKNGQAQENDRKRRAQAAAERKAKVMAQMNQMQKKFAKSHQSELATMETCKSSTEDQNASQSSLAGRHSAVLRAVGREKMTSSSSGNSAQKHTCILCQEDGDENGQNTFVFATYIVNSTVLSCLQLLDPDLNGKHISHGILPSNLKCGPVVTSCGHVMHAKCYQTMYDNLLRQHQDEFNRPSFNVNKQEYLCPICQRLSNCVLPMAPNTNKHLAVKLASPTTFLQWIEKVNTLVTKHTEIRRSKNTRDWQEMSNIILASSCSPSVEGLKTSTFPNSLTNMTTNFAINCAMKSYGDFQALDLEEYRYINICLQAVAMNLHLSQSSEEESSGHLFLPLTQRDMDVLKALVRFGLNLAHMEASYLNAVRSSGLYVLAMCLQPSMLLHASTSILQCDMLNVLMLLTCSMPLIVPDTALGSLDHHVVRLCSIMHLIQIFAGLKPNDQERDTNDPEEADVQKMAKWVSELAGVSDKLPVKARRVRRAMIRFLRCTALFFHFVTDVPLPTLENDDEKVAYARLSEYLSLPKSLRELINDPDTLDLTHTLLQNNQLRGSTWPELPAKLRCLIDLPEDYKDLLNRALTYECPNNAGLDRKTKSLAICLVCGDLVCCESYCCKIEIDGSRAGGCTSHARKCNGDFGLFIKLSSCQLLILSGVNKGCVSPAPYVDRFGEHDVELNRGNPLRLDKQQYQKLSKMWQQNDLQSFIAKAQRPQRNLFDFMF